MNILTNIFWIVFFPVKLSWIAIEFTVRILNSDETTRIVKAANNSIDGFDTKKVSNKVIKTMPKV